MVDRENVIIEIEDALSGNLAKVGHVYKLSLNGLKDKALTDALELLKEHETANLYKCPNCGTWVSAENVVRCEDCAYAFFKEGLVQPGHIVCTKPFTERWQAVKPNNWFCADGERRVNSNE